MAELFVKRSGSVLIADGQESLDVFEGLPRGKGLKAVITQPRSLPRHKLFFALVHRVAQAMGKSDDEVRASLTIDAGYYTPVVTGNHGVQLLPKSIAFHAMDEIQFSELMERCIQVIYDAYKIPPAAVADLLLPQEQAA